MSDLTGKSAVVTGAGKGLGKAIAERLAADGAKVVVSDIDGAAAEAVAGGIDGASAVTCDVTDESQVQALVGACVEQHGGIDIMVPNAGVAGVAPLVETSYEEFRRVTSVNLDGVFLSLKHAVAQMLPKGSGTVVNVASVTGIKSSALIGPYAIAKAGVINMTKCAALEYRAAGLRINAVAPGFVGTDLVDDNLPALSAGAGMDLGPVIEQKQGRLGVPEDVAAVVSWLASDSCNFANGAPFVMDGGLTASLL